MFRVREVKFSFAPYNEVANTSFFSSFFAAVTHIDQRKGKLKFYKISLQDGCVKFLGEKGYFTIDEEGE